MAATVEHFTLPARFCEGLRGGQAPFFRSLSPFSIRCGAYMIRHLSGQLPFVLEGDLQFRAVGIHLAVLEMHVE